MMMKNDDNYENDKPGEIYQACVLICAPWGSVLEFGIGIQAGKEDQLSLTKAWFDHLRLLHKDSDLPILQSHLYASLCHNWHFCSVTAATLVAGIFETMQSCHHVRAFLDSKWGSEERSFVSQMSLSLRTTLCLLLCLPVLTQLHTVERICCVILCFLSKYQGIKIIQCNSRSPVCLNLPHILQRLLLQRHSSTKNYNNSEYVWQIQADRGITTALYDFYAMRKHSVF